MWHNICGLKNMYWSESDFLHPVLPPPSSLLSHHVISSAVTLSDRSSPSLKKWISPPPTFDLSTHCKTSSVDNGTGACCCCRPYCSKDAAGFLRCLITPSSLLIHLVSNWERVRSASWADSASTAPSPAP